MPKSLPRIFFLLVLAVLVSCSPQVPAAQPLPQPPAAIITATPSPVPAAIPPTPPPPPKAGHYKGAGVALDVSPEGKIVNFYLDAALYQKSYMEITCPITLPESKVTEGVQFGFASGDIPDQGIWQISGTFNGQGVSGEYTIESCGDKAMTQKVTRTWSAILTESPPSNATVPGLETAYIYPKCNCEADIVAGQPAYLYWVWDALDEEMTRDFINLAHVILTVDGVPMTDASQASFWGPVYITKYGFGSFWKYPITELPVGTHHIEIKVTLPQTMTDGNDYNGDGKDDLFGPGEVLFGWVDLTVTPYQP